jgi:hypothetical protein
MASPALSFARATEHHHYELGEGTEDAWRRPLRRRVPASDCDPASSRLPRETQAAPSTVSLASAILARLEESARYIKLENRVAKLESQVAELAGELRKLAPEINRSWSEFLDSLASLEEYPAEQVRRVQDAWEHLVKQLGEISPPRAQANEDGGFSMAWDRDEHHLEIEILPSGIVEWFYRNRETDEYEGDEGIDIDDLPRQVVRYLKLTNA